MRLVVFNIVIPIMKGTRADLFAHSLCEPCTIVRLEAALNKASGEVLKRKPRLLHFFMLSLHFLTCCFLTIDYFSITEVAAAFLTIVVSVVGGIHFFFF